MGKITYNLSEFNKSEAENGALVVAIKSDYYNPDDPETHSIDNITYDSTTREWKKTENFLGAGVARYNNQFFLTVDSVEYSFAHNGLGISNPNYVIMMGTVGTKVIPVGNTVISTTTNTTVRRAKSANKRAGTTEEETKDETTIEDKVNDNVVIDYMSVRDQFAVQALRSIMAQVKDPASVGDSVMTNYCEMAYQWAANMMAAAANARATLDDQTASEYVTEAEVGSFESNTEKLLNNIWSALRKTDFEETVQVGEESHTIYSERTINPTLNALLTDLQETISNKKYQRILVKDLDTLTGKLDTLNTNLAAIKNSLDAQTTAINAVADAIDNLQLSPVINNNITIPENNGGE